MRILFRLLAVFGLMASLSACYVTTGNIIPPGTPSTPPKPQPSA